MKHAALLSLALLLSTTGCRSAPGLAIGAGVVLATAGTIVAVDVDPTTPDDEGANVVVGSAAIAVAVVGVAFLAAGITGYAQNAEAAKAAPGPSPAPSPGLSPTAPAAPASPAAAVSSAGATAPSLAVRDDGAPSGEAKLASHIRLASRGGRCEAARFMLARLERQAPDEASALRAGDAHVQRCAP